MSLKNTLLIISDLQNDFCTTMPFGMPPHLPVPGADKEFIRAIDNYAHTCAKDGGQVVATQDWHPFEHKSFASNQRPVVAPYTLGELGGRPQVFWPNHCVQDTTGAQLAHGFDTSPVKAIFRKGMNPNVDSYSGFADLDGRATGMESYVRFLLEAHVIKEIVVVGLALDYCVAATAIGALPTAKEYKIPVIVSAALTRAVAEDSKLKSLADFANLGIDYRE